MRIDSLRRKGLQVALWFISVRLMFQYLAHFLCALSELFLKFANQLVILAFSVGEVVVGELSVLLLELALNFIPGALELEFVHINYFGAGRGGRLY
jgi:hypothetical protein